MRFRQAALYALLVFAAIGLGGYTTIGRHHSMMTHPLSRIGQYEDNPCRQDIEEIGDRIGVHLALNVVLGDQKRIIAAFAGPPGDVMRRGVPCVRSLPRPRIPA